MTTPTSLSRLRLITDDELEREFAAADHDELTRQAILLERFRRLSPATPVRRSSALSWAILVVATIGAVLAGVAAYPVVAELLDPDWFDF